MDTSYDPTALSEQFPGWHQQTQHLDALTERPLRVLEDFFSNYTPDSFLQGLKDRPGAQSDPACEEAKAIVQLHGRLKKLVEACWLILKEAKQNNRAVNPLLVAPPFEKKMMLLHELYAAPRQILSKIFKYGLDERLQFKLSDYLHLALTSVHRNAYEDAGSRQSIVSFCFALKRLMAAWQLLIGKDHHRNKKPSARYWQTNNCLTEEEKQYPEKVIASFRQQFSRGYCRTEFWIFTEAIICYKGAQPLKYGHILFDMEQLICITEAVWLYPFDLGPV